MVFHDDHDPVFRLKKGIHNFRIKVFALLLLNNIQGLFRSEGVSAGPVGHEHIKLVCQTDNTACQRNGVLFQSFGIS